MSFEEIMKENGLDFEIIKSDSLKASKFNVYDREGLKVSFLLNKYYKKQERLTIDGFRTEKRGALTSFEVFKSFYSTIINNSITCILFREFTGKNFPFNSIKYKYLDNGLLRQFYNFKYMSLFYMKPDAVRLSKKKVIGCFFGKINGIEHLKVFDKQGFIRSYFSILDDSFTRYEFAIKFEKESFTGRFDEGRVTGNYFRQSYCIKEFNPKIPISLTNAETDSFNNLSFEELEELVRTVTRLEE
ncbi:MAG: hypothetical protein JW791_05100 [Nanoarchaeota archaeon]|nr:hypothetical protein [Nanoarchaeota archaeon]